MNDYARAAQQRHQSRTPPLAASAATPVEGFKFRRQRPVGPYVCDFVCLEAFIIVELDGSQHVVQATYDANRDAFLRSRGFRILRFWNGLVFSQMESVVDTLFEALHRPEMDGRFD